MTIRTLAPASVTTLNPFSRDVSNTSSYQRPLLTPALAPARGGITETEAIQQTIVADRSTSSPAEDVTMLPLSITRPSIIRTPSNVLMEAQSLPFVPQAQAPDVVRTSAPSSGGQEAPPPAEDGWNHATITLGPAASQDTAPSVDEFTAACMQANGTRCGDLCCLPSGMKIDASGNVVATAADSSLSSMLPWLLGGGALLAVLLLRK